MKALAFVSKLLLKLGAGFIVIGGVVAVGGYALIQSVPEAMVLNQCDEPIAMPEGIQLVPGIPAEIGVQDSATIPIVIGAGHYRLYETGDGLYLELPRNIPTVGDTIRIANAGLEPKATFQGRPVTFPMEETLENNRVYTVVVCAP